MSPGFDMPAATPSKEAPPARPGGYVIPPRRSWILAGIVAATVAATLLSPGTNSPSQAGVLMQLPIVVNVFAGVEQGMSPAERAILPADTELVRKVYHSLQDDQIQASIVLAGGEKRSIHRPEVCLPGQGWTIKSSEVVPVKLKDGTTMKATLLTLERTIPTGPGKSITLQSLFLYWFVGKNITTPSHLTRVWLTSWDRVIHNLNHRWAFISLNSLVMDNLKQGGKNREQTLQMLQGFAADLVPKIEPDEEKNAP
jgi:hypothetical protein